MLGGGLGGAHGEHGDLRLSQYAGRRARIAASKKSENDSSILSQESGSGHASCHASKSGERPHRWLRAPG